MCFSVSKFWCPDFSLLGGVLHFSDMFWGICVQEDILGGLLQDFYVTFGTGFLFYEKVVVVWNY